MLAESAEAGQSIRYACRDFATRKTIMTALRTPNGTTRASRRRMEKVIHNFYSDFFDSHVPLLPQHLSEDGNVIPKVEVRHAIMSVMNRTSPGPYRIKLEHLKYLPPVLIDSLTRLFTRYLSECKVPKQWKTSRTVLLYKKGEPHNIRTIAQSAYSLSSTRSSQE
ncbi:hypothetical protein RB195_018943 [Necator americanus]